MKVKVEPAKPDLLVPWPKEGKGRLRYLKPGDEVDLSDPYWQRRLRSEIKPFVEKTPKPKKEKGKE